MITVLVLCTGNSCRSILGETLLNQLGEGRVRAFSAGSHPTGRVNANALATLMEHGVSTEGLTSKSWESLDGIAFDIVITVCDQAAGETCPAYLGKAPKVHWGLPDPAAATGSEQDVKAAFEATYDALKRRIERFLALPIETLPEQELIARLNEIGKIDD
jgi:arsenate reductase